MRGPPLARAYVGERSNLLRPAILQNFKIIGREVRNLPPSRVGYNRIYLNKVDSHSQNRLLLVARLRQR